MSMNSGRRSARIAPRFAVCVALGTAGALALASCSTREGFEDTKQEFPPRPEAGMPVDAGPPVCGIHCSRDLKQVLDGCEGSETVVAVCNADQGCGDGKCVDACTAAVLSKGSAGCDFRTVFPNGPGDMQGSCFAALLANTWDRPVNITAEYGKAPLDISQSTYVVTRTDGDPVYTRLEGPLPPGEVAVVFLSDGLESNYVATVHCPTTVTPAITFDPMRYGTTRTEAFRLQTDAPVSAYSIAPYGGYESFEPTATLLLPVSSWSTSYIAVSAYPFNADRPRTLQIIASEDDTKVSIRPTVKVSPGAGVPGTEPGVTQTWTLARGEVLQFLQPSLTGSPIVADKPIAVFGGAECSDLPGPEPFCDTLQQQIPPFAQWGTAYAVVPAPPRIASVESAAREQVPYTIVGAVDGTQLTYEPSRPRGAPDTLAMGEQASFITDELFVVKSQDSAHPFHVNVYMTSANFGGGRSGATTTGDPDFVNVPPVDQYLDRYVFLTDFTYPDTGLTIVRRKTAKGFLPVELACAGGEITGFAPLGSSGEYEYAWVRLTSGFHPQKVGDGECGYGRHEAKSDGPFAVTVWGVGPYSSYGFVGGTGLRPIHDAPPPTVK